MGKHERGLVKAAEKITVKILNGKPVVLADRKNPWFKHAIKIAGQIKIDYPKLISALHLGNRYDNAGDILLKMANSSSVFIEVKMSESKTGVGTKANIGQDSLTEHGLFVGDVMSWSEFRDVHYHVAWVKRYLNLFKNYPKNIKQLKNDIQSIEAKARYLRSHDVRDILLKIRNCDRIEKIKYLKYLKRQKQNNENIKKFYVLIMLGIHDGKSISNLIQHDNLLRELENLMIYYSNIRGGEVVVTKENVGGRISKLITGSIFKIVFPADKTYCVIVWNKQNAKIKRLLQIVFHWKNISQGIKTPCLNIFDLHSGSV